MIFYSPAEIDSEEARRAYQSKLAIRGLLQEHLGKKVGVDPARICRMISGQKLDSLLRRRVEKLLGPIWMSVELFEQLNLIEREFGVDLVCSTLAEIRQAARRVLGRDAVPVHWKKYQLIARLIEHSKA